MPPELLLAIVGVFVMVAVATASAASWWLAKNSPERRRLRTLATAGGAGGSTTGVVTERVMSVSDAPDERLARLSRLLPRSPQEMSRVQRRLTAAGYPQYKYVIYYSLAELVLPVVFAVAVLLTLGLYAGWLTALFAGALGYLVPSFYVGRLTRHRQKLIRNGLPDALDLITVCVEAGSGLDQAIVKASEELYLTHPALTDELRTIVTEIRAGKPRLEAFKNFAERTGVDDVRTLVSVLIQTDRFGTSIAQALRTHSETARTKRRQRAEERAGKVGVKLVFPLALCLFPALYIVCFGPVVVRIYHAFFVAR
jgi:tight adherence protein C